MKLYTVGLLFAVLVVAGIAIPFGGVLAQETGAALSLRGTTTASDRGVAASRQLERVAVSGSGFAADELIGLWLTLPDGVVLGLDRDDLRADAAGEFSVSLSLGAGLPTGLHRFSARGQSSGKGAIAPFILLPGTGPQPTAGTQLTLTPATARQLDTVELTARGFAPNERVALWVTLPDGAVVGLGQSQADADGVFGSRLLLSGALPVGRHYFTARGISSERTAITPFVLQYGNGLELPGARLAANIGRVPQRTTLDVSAEGFTAGESISLWLTLPDGAVAGLGEIRADAAGQLSTMITLDESLPIGTHYLSFRSNLSNQSGFVRVDLAPGPQAPGEE